jgi:DHA2 family methylenomycin A resistance protein-like MFS transporter
VIITLAVLALGVIDGGHGKLLSAATLAPLAGAVAGGALFVTIEQRSRAPMLPLALLRNRDISASNLIGLAINFGLYGQLFVFSLYFQRSLGYSALQTGLALLPEGAAVAAGSFFSGRLIARHGPRPVLLGGLLMGSVGFAGLAAVGAHTAYALLVVPLLLTGYGMSTTMPAVTAAVLSAAPGNRAGISAALLNASRQVGSMLGVALLGSVVAAAGIDAGLRITMVIAAAAFLAGLGLGAKLVGRSRALAGVS